MWKKYRITMDEKLYAGVLWRSEIPKKMPQYHQYDENPLHRIPIGETLSLRYTFTHTLLLHPQKHQLPKFF